MKRIRIRTAEGVAAALLLASGWGTTETRSPWRGGAPAGGPAAFDDGRIRGAVSNDSEYVSITLRTTNQELERLVFREGLTWWFDREGGTKKSFGVRSPLPEAGENAPGRGEEVEGASIRLNREARLRFPAELE